MKCQLTALDLSTHVYKLSAMYIKPTTLLYNTVYNTMPVYGHPSGYEHA